MVNALPAAVTAMGAHSVGLLPAISGIFGSISMVAWIFVILPQLYVNYRAKSADGISMTFLIVWMLGDVANLIGALLTHLAPTAIALAFYFCFADLALISQCVYYNAINARKDSQNRPQRGEANEDSPLLARRRSTASSHVEESADATQKTSDDSLISDASPWISNSLALLAVHLIGFAGWFVSYKAGAWKSHDPEAHNTADATRTTAETVGLVLGYISAVLYLCARIPQIIKNYRDKSCDGLSLLFFLLSLTGNGTYGISIVTFSQEKKYLLNTIPWLLGSVGTMVEDFIIFVQFQLYADNIRAATSEV